jgi:hypothetical protein
VETALELANSSLRSTMCYLNTALLLADDPAAANAALDVAELHLAHTLRRTQMAVQMAAAIRAGRAAATAADAVASAVHADRRWRRGVQWVAARQGIGCWLTVAEEGRLQ